MERTYSVIPCVAFSLSNLLSFDFQAALLKNDETKALTPASLQKELNNLLKFNPDFAEAVSFFQNLLLGCKERSQLFNISDRHTNSRSKRNHNVVMVTSRPRLLGSPVIWARGPATVFSHSSWVWLWTGDCRLIIKNIFFSLPFVSIFKN